MDIKEYDDYVLDIKHTLIASISYSMFLILIGVFIVKGFSLVSAFESEDIRVLAAIVYMLSSIKLLSWISVPNIEYKPRK